MPLPPPSAPNEQIVGGGSQYVGCDPVTTAMLRSGAKSNGIFERTPKDELCSSSDTLLIGKNRSGSCKSHEGMSVAGQLIDTRD